MTRLMSWKYLVIIVTVFVVVGLSFVYKKQPTSSLSKEQQGVVNEIDTSNWTNYANGQLGFSIKIPSEVPTVYRCPNNKQKSETPIKIFEDNQSGSVYITAEYYYDANWSQAAQKYIGGCDKITYSLDLLKSEESSKYLSGRSSHPFLGWKIIINSPKDEKELENFVKQNFGSTCSIVSKVAQPDGNYAVSVKGRNLIKNGVGVMDESCLTNFVYKILYSPEKHKMMSVILGQECTFGTDPSETSSYKCYDDIIIQSFKFQ